MTTNEQIELQDQSLLDSVSYKAHQKNEQHFGGKPASRLAKSNNVTVLGAFENTQHFQTPHRDQNSPLLGWHMTNTPNQPQDSMFAPSVQPQQQIQKNFQQMPIASEQTTPQVSAQFLKAARLNQNQYPQDSTFKRKHFTPDKIEEDGSVSVGTKALEQTRISQGTVEEALNRSLFKPDHLRGNRQIRIQGRQQVTNESSLDDDTNQKEGHNKGKGQEPGILDQNTFIDQQKDQQFQILGLQEVNSDENGVQRFKCVPVTDYSKMILKAQRQNQRESRVRQQQQLQSSNGGNLSARMKTNHNTATRGFSKSAHGNRNNLHANQNNGTIFDPKSWFSSPVPHSTLSTHLIRRSKKQGQKSNKKTQEVPLRTRIQKTSRVVSPRNQINSRMGNLDNPNKVSLVCSTNLESLQNQTHSNTGDGEMQQPSAHDPSNLNFEREQKWAGEKGLENSSGGVRVRTASHQNRRDSNQNDQPKVVAKLRSISSDIRKSILPKQHNKINQIHRHRIERYLNLMAMHGDRNQQLLKSLFHDKKTVVNEKQLLKLVNNNQPNFPEKYGFVTNNDLSPNRRDFDDFNGQPLKLVQNNDDENEGLIYSPFNQTEQIMQIQALMGPTYQTRQNQKKILKTKEFVAPITNETRHVQEESDNMHEYQNTFNARQNSLVSCDSLFASNKDQRFEIAGQGPPKEAFVNAIMKERQNIINKKGTNYTQMPTKSPQTQEQDFVKLNKTQKMQQCPKDPFDQIIYKAGLYKQPQNIQPNHKLHENPQNTEFIQSDQSKFECYAEQHVVSSESFTNQRDTSGQDSSFFPQKWTSKDYQYVHGGNRPNQRIHHSHTMKSDDYNPQFRKSLSLSGRKNSQAADGETTSNPGNQTPTSHNKSSNANFRMQPATNLASSQHISDDLMTEIPSQLSPVIDARHSPQLVVNGLVFNKLGRKSPQNTQQVTIVQEQVDQFSKNDQEHTRQDNNTTAIISSNTQANNQALNDQKIVKTYEFHLPMHNIREESSKMEQYLAKPGASQTHQTSPNKQQSPYKSGIKRKSKGYHQNAKDDISSQMLDDGPTTFDHQNQNSLKMLNGSYSAGKEQIEIQAENNGNGDTGNQRRNRMSFQFKGAAGVRRSQQFIQNFPQFDQSVPNSEGQSKFVTSKPNKFISQSIDDAQVIDFIKQKNQIQCQQQDRLLSNLSMIINSAKSKGINLEISDVLKNQIIASSADPLENGTFASLNQLNLGSVELKQRNALNQQKDIILQQPRIQNVDLVQDRELKTQTLIESNQESQQNGSDRDLYTKNLTENTLRMNQQQNPKTQFSSDNCLSRDENEIQNSPKLQEIAEQNFELFKNQLEEKALFASYDHDKIQKRNIESGSHSQTGSVIKEMKSEHIEVVNISRASDTEKQGNPSAKTSQIQLHFSGSQGKRDSETGDGKDIATSPMIYQMPYEEAANLLYQNVGTPPNENHKQKNISVFNIQNPYKQNVPIPLQEFKPNSLIKATLKQRPKTQSATRRILKGTNRPQSRPKNFKQPGFRLAQQFFPKHSKTKSLIRGLQNGIYEVNQEEAFDEQAREDQELAKLLSQKMFKTFKANNELFIRIDNSMITQQQNQSGFAAEDQQSLDVVSALLSQQHKDKLQKMIRAKNTQGDKYSSHYLISQKEAPEKYIKIQKAQSKTDFDTSFGIFKTLEAKTFLENNPSNKPQASDSQSANQVATFAKPITVQSEALSRNLEVNGQDLFNSQRHTKNSSEMEQKYQDETQPQSTARFQNLIMNKDKQIEKQKSQKVRRPPQKETQPQSDITLKTLNIEMERETSSPVQHDVLKYVNQTDQMDESAFKRKKSVKFVEKDKHLSDMTLVHRQMSPSMVGRFNMSPNQASNGQNSMSNVNSSFERREKLLMEPNYDDRNIQMKDMVDSRVDEEEQEKDQQIGGVLMKQQIVSKRIYKDKPEHIQVEKRVFKSQQQNFKVPELRLGSATKSPKKYAKDIVFEDTILDSPTQKQLKISKKVLNNSIKNSERKNVNKIQKGKGLIKEARKSTFSTQTAELQSQFVLNDRDLIKNGVLSGEFQGQFPLSGGGIDDQNRIITSNYQSNLLSTYNWTRSNQYTKQAFNAIAFQAGRSIRTAEGTHHGRRNHVKEEVKSTGGAATRQGNLVNRNQQEQVEEQTNNSGLMVLTTQGKQKKLRVQSGNFFARSGKNQKRMREDLITPNYDLVEISGSNLIKPESTKAWTQSQNCFSTSNKRSNHHHIHSKSHIRQGQIAVRVNQSGFQSSNRPSAELNGIPPTRTMQIPKQVEPTLRGPNLANQAKPNNSFAWQPLKRRPRNAQSLHQTYPSQQNARQQATKFERDRKLVNIQITPQGSTNHMQVINLLKKNNSGVEQDFRAAAGNRSDQSVEELRVSVNQKTSPQQVIVPREQAGNSYSKIHGLGNLERAINYLNIDKKRAV